MICLKYRRDYFINLFNVMSKNKGNYRYNKLSNKMQQNNTDTISCRWNMQFRSTIKIRKMCNFIVLWIKWKSNMFIETNFQTLIFHRLYTHKHHTNKQYIDVMIHYEGLVWIMLYFFNYFTLSITLLLKILGYSLNKH